MAIFTALSAGIAAAATAVSGAIAGITMSSIAAFAARTVLMVGVSRLLAKRATKNTPNPTTSSSGARVQLPPSTNNKLPVVYGTAFVSPTIIDAKISTDQQTMWYVCALAEVTDTGTYSFDQIYYGGKLVTFKTGNITAVESLTTNSNPTQVDTSVDGYMDMYLYRDGSSNGVNTAFTAIQILQDSSIPSAQRWTSTDLMSKTAFLIVKIKYNQDANLTGLDTITVKLTNTLTKPGSVLLDYMRNSRYGAGIPAARVDATSFTALDTYSDQTITYIPVGGGSATQARYRINGPVDTGNDCMSNIQDLMDACDSWLQWNEISGKWKVVINQSYTDYTTLGALFSVNNDILIGGIDITPIDLNETYNSVEVQYPNFNIKDQMAYSVIELADYDASLLSPNEAPNQIQIYFPQVNNAVQAQYLGVRRLLQSREDLVITFKLDYSGIQIDAGDVIKVTLAEYGWTDKLFRVNQVQEFKTEEGFLGAQITAFEYNDSIYGDNSIQNFVPAANTGLTDPNIIGTPNAPTAVINPRTDGSVQSLTITANVPATGSVLYMDFNYGLTNNSANHIFYKSVNKGDGSPYTANTSVSITSTDLKSGTYFWSVTARNNQAGKRSGSSSSVVWTGPNVTTYDPTGNVGGVIFDQTAPNVGAVNIIGTYSYTGNSTTFENSADTSTQFDRTIMNFPVYLDGTTVPSTHIYPFFQGTSTTANGYSQNSTAAFAPSGAALLAMDTLPPNNDWWVLQGYYFGDNYFSFDNFMNIEMNAQFVANANTTIQLVGSLGDLDTNNPYIVNTYVYADTRDMLTIPLTANVPVWVKYNIAALGPVVQSNYGAIWWRNLTGSTRVYCTSAVFNLGVSYRVI